MAGMRFNEGGGDIKGRVMIRVKGGIRVRVRVRVKIRVRLSFEQRVPQRDKVRVMRC